MKVLFIPGKLVFKLASTVTLYSSILLALVTVGAILTLTERFRMLPLKTNTFQQAIVHIHMSSPFVFLVLGPFLYCTEIWKRIEFINSWETFQVIFGFLHVYRYTRTNSF